MILTIAVLPVGTLAAQSRDELRQKYGEARSETFSIRPGIQVTATYAADGRVTELLISPASDAGLIKSRGNGLSRDAMNAIIDELVPLAARGKFVRGEFIDMICLPADDCVGSSRTYEKVSIYYNAAPEGRVYYAVVWWMKR
jgi:hypothetical protein